MMLDLVKQLAKAMKDTNTSDITEPSKFSGADHHWESGTTSFGPISKPKDGSPPMTIPLDLELPVLTPT